MALDCINIDPKSFVYLQGCLANLDVGGDTANPVKSALVPSEHVLEGCGGNYFSSALILPKAFKIVTR